MTLYVPPRMDTLGDVNLAGLDDGDLLTYVAATDTWIPITRANLRADLTIGDFFSIAVAAGGNQTVVVPSPVPGLDFITSVVVMDSTLGLTYFPDWEVVWISGSRQTAGRFLGPGPTTWIGTAPINPVGTDIHFKVYNRSAALTPLRVQWTGVTR